jgi:bifunctional DNA-binding transcriptional regulator/antitoxin component of YhaV-PrlF toxin-antitoxin module
MNKKPIYKLMDGKGRVLIPKELRTASGMDYGDIVRLNISNGMVSVQKVDIIEIGDQSPEAVEAYVRAAFKTMSDDTRLSLISDLTALLQQKKSNGAKSIGRARKNSRKISKKLPCAIKTAAPI